VSEAEAKRGFLGRLFGRGDKPVPAPAPPVEPVVADEPAVPSPPVPEAAVAAASVEPAALAAVVPVAETPVEQANADPALLAFKRQADPLGLLNPGKMVAWDRPDFDFGAGKDYVFPGLRESDTADLADD
jgi:hypothetical protein